MKIRTSLLYAMAFLTAALPACATVAITSPANNSTVGTSVPVAASSSTSCSAGVASSGIYVDNVLQYTANGNAVKANVEVAPGKHNLVVQEWDFCGGVTNASVGISAVTSAQVSVATPTAGSTVGSNVGVVASATTACAQGVSSMGIYHNNQLIYQAAGATMNTSVNLGAGNQTLVVQEWDRCGGSTNHSVNVNVAGSGTTISNIQAAPGWNQWGELPPVYGICNAPCNGVGWSMTQHESAESLSGNGTIFYIDGTTPYADVLWSNPVIGQGNQQGLTDSSHTLIPTLHNFQLSMDVYITDLAVTQNTEFDINMYENGVGMEWGTECNHLNGGVWDIWNNVNAQWVHTSVPCNLNNAAWNHVSIQVQRESNNDLLYQSITVNGVVSPLNITVAPFSVPSGWWGMTVNYQMDGDHAMHANKTYVDNMSLNYW